MFLAPMTLPCTGPLVVSAFVIGGVSGSDALVDSLVYFLFYALGFGWPLVVLPILAAPGATPDHPLPGSPPPDHRGAFRRCC